MENQRFRAGDPVSVRSPEEILATLDASGTCDNLPFMPEMVDWCGKSFHVQRRVEKTCVADHPLRRFPANDVVILDGPRCDGNSHDGCGHGCRILWKEAWLRPAAETVATDQRSAAGLAQLRSRLKVKTDELHYFCQSTELYKSTGPFPKTQKRWTARIAFAEIRSGDLSAMHVLQLLVRWSWQKLLRWRGGDRWLRGPHQRTPSESLGLQPGETVRVKSRAQIGQTLDQKGRNRGMGICSEMTRCCGVEADVRYRVQRIIDEHTGVMREIPDAVVLQNLRNRGTLGEECLCYDQLGDCPRGELMYWREIWLERVDKNKAQ
ncbi:MAG TPA: hypothetical protein VGN07_18120 [Steroidobacteraceae bacterium]